MTEHSATEAMRQAYEAGLSCFPLGRNKRPAVLEWAPYFEHQPDLAVMTGWLASDLSGYAVVMGGPERLLAIDLEEAFVTSRMPELAQRLRDEELYATFSNWMDGYLVGTPSGGCHIVIHLMGDDPVPGNEKLAMDATGKVIAETRGQRGYIVGYDSNGDTHPSGGRWILDRGGYDSIAWAEPDEWTRVRDVLVSFDEAPLAPVDHGVQPAAAAKSSTGGVSLAEIERGSSYLEAARAAMPTMAEVLTRYGWVFSHQDADFSYWVRPGKDPRLGHSATINASDRLCVFSSSAHPVPMSARNFTQTFSVIDVLAFYEGVSGGEIVRSYKPPSPGPGAPSQPPSELVLPADFWSATPLLAHIRQAAYARMLSPDTLYEAVKTLYAATIPWNFRLPQEGTFDYVGVMVGNSGSGKTRSKKAAIALLPPELFALDGVRLAMPAPSSGEGIVESYIRRERGKQVGLEYRGLGFYIDEGRSFFTVQARDGNTLAEVVKSAWMGEMTGNVAATVDRHRVLTASEVRLSVLIGIQIDVASEFLTAAHTNGGLPQRVSWKWAYHPDRVPESPVEWPGHLPVKAWDRNLHGGGDNQQMLYTLEIEDSVEREYRQRQEARENSPDSGLQEAHGDFSTMKTAGVLALMHGEMRVTQAFWDLACADWNLSCSVRNEVARRSKQGDADRDVAIGRAQAARSLATIGVYLDRAIASLVKKVNSADGPLTATDAKNHLSSYRKRHKLAYTEIVEAAVARGHLVIHSSGGLTPT